MDLVSMKRSPAEAKEAATPADTAPEYPYGLRLRLEDEELQKLGLTTLPDVGTSLVLTARVEVCGTSAYDSESGKHRSVELQLTDLALAPEQRPANAEALYPTMQRG